MNKKIVILGTSESVTVCDCCGRKNLKRTVVIDNPTSGTVTYYGTTCASRAHAIEAGEILKQARRADAAVQQAEWDKKNAEYCAELEKWEQWLRENGKGPSTLERINSLGGYAPARAMYQAFY